MLVLLTIDYQLSTFPRYLMKLFPVAISALLLLTACGQATLLEDAIETASGRITEVKVRVQNTVDPIVETAENVNKRIKQVQSGAQMLKNGVDAIKEGVGGE
jgi:hypothetical protein